MVKNQGLTVNLVPLRCLNNAATSSSEVLTRVVSEMWQALGSFEAVISLHWYYAGNCFVSSVACICQVTVHLPSDTTLRRSS
jgi:hypothetical protein